MLVASRRILVCKYLIKLYELVLLIFVVNNPNLRVNKFLKSFQNGSQRLLSLKARVREFT